MGNPCAFWLHFVIALISAWVFEFKPAVLKLRFDHGIQSAPGRVGVHGDAQLNSLTLMLGTVLSFTFLSQKN